MPRIQRLLHCLMSVPGSTIAGSLPPNSRVTGVRCLVAAAATWEKVCASADKLFQYRYTNLSTRNFGTNECYMLDFGRRSQGLCLISRTTHKLGLRESDIVASPRDMIAEHGKPYLHQLRIEVTGPKTFLDDINKPL